GGGGAKVQNGLKRICRQGPAGWSTGARKPIEWRGGRRFVGQKEAPAVGDLTAGALSRRSIRHGHEGEPWRPRRLMRARFGGNRRRLKFWPCDISAKVSSRRSAGASVRSALDAGGVVRAPRRRRGFRGRRLGGLHGDVGIGRWHVRRDGRKRRGCWGMYDRRWYLRAIRQEMGVERNKAEREHRPDH